VKEYLRQLTAQLDNDLARGCLVREYLQARVQTFGHSWNGNAISICCGRKRY
jgi:hypothetical protein